MGEFLPLDLSDFPVERGHQMQKAHPFRNKASFQVTIISQEMIISSNIFLVMLIFGSASSMALDLVLEIIINLIRAFTIVLPLDIVQAGFT